MTFLEQVAKDIMLRHGSHLDRTAVVFPNKRASLFLNIELRRLVEQPIWAPRYITISELFRNQSHLTVADSMTQVMILYKVFTEITGSTESLDSFWGWGELLISDFDDIDKHMADADKVLANVTDLSEIECSDYLTPHQRSLLTSFFSTFKDDSSRLQRDFHCLWKSLSQVYHAFKAALRNKGLAYEGMLYRDVVEQKAYHLPSEHYIFVGFNLLHDVEQALFLHLKHEGKAEFYWDYDKAYLPDHSPFAEAGMFIREYNTPSRFPSQLHAEHEVYDMFGKEKKIDVVSSVSDTLQAAYAKEWLMEEIEVEKSLGSGSANIVKMPRYALGRRCAVVLCNESLLPTLLEHLPQEIGAVNVTLGFPLHHAPAMSLLDNLIALRREGTRQTPSGLEFRQKHVCRLLRHPYIKRVSPAASQLLLKLLAVKRFWLSADVLTHSGDEVLQLFFAPLATDAEQSRPKLVHILPWCMEVIHAVGKPRQSLQSDQDNSPATQADGSEFTMESLYRIHTQLSAMLLAMQNAGQLGIGSPSDDCLLRILTSSLATATVPFHGEPAEGVQIMGVLETRNLDFDQLLVLSASDDYMPKLTADSSFLPCSVRKAYGLTVPDHKVAIYAYYFFRMISRCRQATMVYNNAAGAMSQGEMSRFLLQLTALAPHTPNLAISRKTLSVSTLPAERKSRCEIQKTAEVKQMLNQFTTISPSAINNYLRCPLFFYYTNVLGLREPGDDEEEMEVNVFGNIFHRAMELIYLHLTRNMNEPSVCAQQIELFLKEKRAVENFVDRAFAEVYFNLSQEDTTSGGGERNLNGIELVNHSAICVLIRRTLKADKLSCPFTVRGLEEKGLNLTFTLTAANQQTPENTELVVSTHQGVRTLRLRGAIDRLDELTDSSGQPYLRVLDYKTGRKSKGAPKSISDIFDNSGEPDWHPAYYRQTLTYCVAVADDPRLNPAGLPVRPALLFVNADATELSDPVLKVGKEQIHSAADHRSVLIDNLTSILTEIFVSDQPFQPTPREKRCNTCPFASLCGLS